MAISRHFSHPHCFRTNSLKADQDHLISRLHFSRKHRLCLNFSFLVNFLVLFSSPLLGPNRALGLLRCEPLVVDPAGLEELGLKTVRHRVGVGQLRYACGHPALEGCLPLEDLDEGEERTASAQVLVRQKLVFFLFFLNIHVRWATRRDRKA